MNNNGNATLQIGQKIERWTIIGAVASDPGGARKWLCRCDCGNEREVLERSLKYGASKSCGCLRRERLRARLSPDLTGQTFGELTALRRLEPAPGSGAARWLCECACGAEYEVQGTLLVTGKRTHCAGKAHRKNYAYCDIAGQKFGRLTALFPSGERSKRGGVVWHCRCDCGNEVDVPYNSLRYSTLKSCSCQKREHARRRKEHLPYVAGTSVAILQSKKVPTNNTSGIKGVYLVRGKYIAKIVFQKKQFFLGTYDNIEDAAEARRQAEAVLFDGVAAHYHAWKRRADADPEWAAQNPVQVSVTQEKGALSVVMLPVLREKKEGEEHMPKLLPHRKKQSGSTPEQAFERCVLCGAVTTVLKTTPLEQRSGYLEGAGQLCPDCARQNMADEREAMGNG